jgi:hypothetical protein
VNTLPVGIVEVDWRWSRTQYRNDLWIEPKIRSYRLYLDQYKNLDVQISCKKMTGNYLVTNTLLSISVTENLYDIKPCDSQAMDDTYLNDLARVVNYVADGDRLVLELSNNAGYMYFSNKP